MNHLKMVVAGLLAGASMVSIAPAFAAAGHDAQPQCDGEKDGKGTSKPAPAPAPAPAPKPPAAR